MQTAKIFENGRSQAVRLPKEFRFNGSEVYIQRIGEAVILCPKESIWENFIEGLGSFSEDFMEDGRQQSIAQEREEI